MYHRGQNSNWFVQEVIENAILLTQLDIIVILNIFKGPIKQTNDNTGVELCKNASCRLLKSKHNNNVYPCICLTVCYLWCFCCQVVL